MKSTVQAAIDAAKHCGISVKIIFATEGKFHHVTARHLNDVNGRVFKCMMSDPLRAIQGAIDGLVARSDYTTLH